MEVTWQEGISPARWDPRELDGLYATRVLLECLALSVALATVHPTHIWTRISRVMSDRADGPGTVEGWLAQDNHLHRQLTLEAGSSIARRLQSLADRESRLVSRGGGACADVALTSTDDDHATILEALHEGDGPAAVSALAHHIGDRAVRVLAALAPGFRTVTVPRAIELIDQGRELMNE